MEKEKAMRPVHLSTTALIAIAIPAFGILAIPVLNGSLHASTAQAQSKVEELNTRAKELIDRLRHGAVPEGIAKSNGRVEATQVDVAAKYPGRLDEVNVEEGDEVERGQVIGRISSPEYEAQLRGAQSQVLRAKQALAEAEAQIAQRKADHVFAQKDLQRGQELVGKGWLTKQVFDQRVDKADAAEAGLRAAEAQREAARFAIESAESEVTRIKAILADLTLVSPRNGRVQYLIRRAGEVVGAGERIVTVLDLKDVYMTIYLPAVQAGQLALGDEARMTLDPFPQYLIPATVSFVAADAQFTPKSVETAEERAKLMFRIKLQIDPSLLGKYHNQVKTGLRGMGFVRTDSAKPWSNDLAVKLPQ
jgi:HlyD family secretion protein